MKLFETNLTPDTSHCKYLINHYLHLSLRVTLSAFMKVLYSYGDKNCLVGFLATLFAFHLSFSLSLSDCFCVVVAAVLAGCKFLTSLFRWDKFSGKTVLNASRDLKGICSVSRGNFRFNENLLKSSFLIFSSPWPAESFCFSERLCPSFFRYTWKFRRYYKNHRP